MGQLNNLPQTNTMAEDNQITIQCLDNGKYVVLGGKEIKLIDAEGNPLPTKNRFGLCGCGKSKNKPFCDGSHKEA